MQNHKEIVPLYAISLNADRPPLGLGSIIANVKEREKTNNRILFENTFVLTKEEFKDARQRFKEGIYLFSTYIWSLEDNLLCSKIIKEIYPGSLVVFGGPNIPRDKENASNFMMKYTWIDILNHGEGEIAIAEIIDEYFLNCDYTNIAGLTFRRQNHEIISTGSVSAVDDLDSLLSPMLEGTFDEYLKNNNCQVICLETTRGCPYSCGFCDWGQATNSKIRAFKLDKIYKELEWIAKNKIPVIEITDSNFGILKRDIEITEYLCKIKDKYGFPKEVCSNFAKNNHDNITKIIKMTKDAGMVSQAILSMQTLDTEVLQIINRKNLNKEHYQIVLDKFRKLKLPVTAELMLGLPGASLKSTMEDLQWCCDRNLGVYAHSTLLLTNTKINSREYREGFHIKTASETKFFDSEYLNSIQLSRPKAEQIVSTSTMTEDDYLKLIKLMSTFHIFYGESILKYIMVYLQNEYNIRQIDFLYKLSQDLLIDYPLVKKVCDMGDITSSTIIFEGDEDVIWDIIIHNKWKEFYNEIYDYICKTYHIEGDKILYLVINIQKSVMAYYGRNESESIRFDHDFGRYYNDFLNMELNKKLEDYEGFQLKITDPLKICTKEKKPNFYEPHHGHIELASQINPVRFGFDLNDLEVF